MNVISYVLAVIAVGCLTSQGLLAQTNPDPRTPAARPGEASTPGQKPPSPRRPPDSRAKSGTPKAGDEISGACPALPAPSTSPSTSRSAKDDAKGRGGEAGGAPKTATECSG